MSTKPVKPHPIRDAHVVAAHQAVTSPDFGNDLLFTTTEAAALLKVHNRTVKNLIHYEKVKSIYIGGERRIPRSEIQRLASLGTGEGQDFATYAAIEKKKRKAEREARKRPSLHDFLNQKKQEAV